MKRFSRILTALTLFSAISLASCSDRHSLVDSGTETGDGAPSFGEISSMTERVGQSGGTTVYSTSVDSLGGTLDGPDADFSITTDALSTLTTITMTVNDLTPEEVVMGPGGQQFSETCLLLMDKPSGYSNSDTYSIFLWDSANSTWVDLDASDLGPVVIASIDHFSRYKIDLKD